MRCVDCRWYKLPAMSDRCQQCKWIFPGNSIDNFEDAHKGVAAPPPPRPIKVPPIPQDLLDALDHVNAKIAKREKRVEKKAVIGVNPMIVIEVNLK